MGVEVATLSVLSGIGCRRGRVFWVIGRVFNASIDFCMELLWGSTLFSDGNSSSVIFSYCFSLR